MGIDTQTASDRPDVIDRVVGLHAGHALHATRHARDKVVSATQASHELFFGEELGGLSLTDRLAVALYACRLSRADGLAELYRGQLEGRDIEGQILDAIDGNKVADLPASTLKAMLAFTEILILDPVKGDREALRELQAAGLSTPDIVALAQLIAYLSYQLRVVAGLNAMKALENA